MSLTRWFGVLFILLSFLVYIGIFIEYDYTSLIPVLVNLTQAIWSNMHYIIGIALYVVLMSYGTLILVFNEWRMIKKFKKDYLSGQ